jgi:iron complex transport system substrate-binding protein
MAERLRRALACLLVVWLAVVLAWPQAATASITVQDDQGRTLRLAQPPQRIVSLLPALTEMVCALGRCEGLVGLDRYSSWPASVKALPRVGGGMDASTEAVLALRPDVVLMASSARGGERLQALGVPVFYAEPQTHADVERLLQSLGTLLGVSGADRVWRGITSGLADAARALPPAAKGWRVYFEVNDAPYAASESSFIGQTLSQLGLANVVPASLGPFPKINPEWVVRADPDLLMLSDRQGQSLAARPGWRQMRALREGRVCLFTPDEADTLVRPGPRLADAAQLMLRCVSSQLARSASGARTP